MAESSYSGVRKASVLLLTLGSEKASKILKHMSDEDIERLTLELAKLEKVNDNEKKTVLSEFVTNFRAREFMASGGIEYARDMLEKAVGVEKALDILERLTTNLQVKPFDFLKKTDPMQLVNVLQNEHPQTIALILCYLLPKQAAQVIGSLPEGLKAEVVKRIAMLDKANPEVVREVERVLERKVSTFVTQDFAQVGGLDTVVEFMNSLDRTTEKEILDKLSETDPELAEEIRRHMFVFEDVVKLDDRSVQMVLREVDTKDLSRALKGSSEEIMLKITNNLSKRAGQLLKEEIEFMGPLRVVDVEEAQQKIVNVIRRLEESGEIFIARGGGEELIV
ncbi:MAG TPA: flagellar motor switch protein FliG [Thermotogota bacterium]|jgi:flagellar motor switch protein FliG|nr:flagellar motor switch protein FliG [Thermotogota bacterium]NLZ13613.1 flagellar motor switch protein FliG [Thermotogaceae bacterium]MDD8040615.1 flagellar motor switch protein FliG [Thermotogota bacterium]HNR63056.1 flagellar motor switch protein FliG [Thermotogota bacterium]HNT95206.1 flagellar motor switch protein FliG [Thermotogota bacterium]